MNSIDFRCCFSFSFLLFSNDINGNSFVTTVGRHKISRRHNYYLLYIHIIYFYSKKGHRIFNNRFSFLFLNKPFVWYCYYFNYFNLSLIFRSILLLLLLLLEIESRIYLRINMVSAYNKLNKLEVSIMKFQL